MYDTLQPCAGRQQRCKVEPNQQVTVWWGRNAITLKCRSSFCLATEFLAHASSYGRSTMSRPPLLAQNSLSTARMV